MKEDLGLCYYLGQNLIKWLLIKADLGVMLSIPSILLLAMTIFFSTFIFSDKPYFIRNKRAVGPWMAHWNPGT